MAHDVIGRSHELDVAMAFLGAASPRALVITGEPGIGKTTLWKTAVDRARVLGYQVLSARPTRSEMGLAFAALTDLLAPVGDEVLAALPDPQRRALEAALLRRAPVRSGYDQRAVCTASYSVLRELGRHHRVLIAIDDAQWLDRASARVLEYVVRRLTEPGIRILVSERPGAWPFAIRRVLPTPQTLEMQLSPLDRGALAQVVRERLGRQLSLRASLRIGELSGGNPFFALELARAELLASSGASTRDLPRSLQDVVRHHISTLSPTTRRLLLVVSATRAPTVELICSVEEMPADVALTELEAARLAGVIEIDPATSRVSFTHPLLEAGVYAHASPPARRRGHSRLSQLVEAIEERARHLALSVDGPDSALAAFLDSAAEHARSRGAPEAAGDLAERALNLTPDGCTDDRMRRSLKAADYLFHAGDIDAAVALLHQVRASGTTGHQLAVALRSLGEIRLHQANAREAQEILTEALAAAGDDAELKCRVELLLAFAANNTADLGEAQLHAHRALECIDSVDDPALISETLAVVAVTDFMNGVGVDEERLGRALELEDPFHQVSIALRPSIIAGLIALYVGRLHESGRLLAGMRTEVIARGHESDLAFVASNLCWLETLRGRLDVAAAMAQEAIETAQRLESVSGESFALATGALADAYRGDLELAGSRARRALSLTSPMGGANSDVWAQWALVVAALSAADPAAAVDAAEPFLAYVEREGLVEPVRVMPLADGVEALIAHQYLERADVLLQVLFEAASRLERPWALVQAQRGRALWHGARGELSDAGVWIQRALDGCANLELELEVARTELVAGQLARRRKQRRDARELLTRAQTRFAKCGARAWAERAEHELARVTTSKPDAGNLTATEERIAAYAASGLTNRQISSRMGISVKTVEGNMTRIYTKLGIRSRAELGARIARR